MAKYKPVMQMFACWQSQYVNLERGESRLWMNNDVVFKVCTVWSSSKG